MNFDWLGWRRRIMKTDTRLGEIENCIKLLVTFMLNNEYNNVQALMS